MLFVFGRVLALVLWVLTHWVACARAVVLMCETVLSRCGDEAGRERTQEACCSQERHGGISVHYRW